MRCRECDNQITLKDAKFCPKCGAKVPELAQTPPLEKTFTGVREISLHLGNKITVLPSQTPQTTLTIEASEEIKQDLLIALEDGLLKISRPPVENNFSGISIGRNSVVIGRGNVVMISGSSFDSEEDDIKVRITTPTGTDINIDSADAIQGVIGDLESRISVDTSGSCNIDIGKVTDFSADTSGSLRAKINTLNGGDVEVDASGSCQLTINRGQIRKLSLDVSGSCQIDINAQTDRADIDVSGSLSGSLKARSIKKDVSGSDRLTLIR